MNTFQKFISDWRAHNMQLAKPIVKPQGAYIVWGYSGTLGTSGHREHVCTFRELGRCIAEANGYAKKTRFAHIVASSGALVYDTRFPEQRQAERCATCLTDLDKGPERIEMHGIVFDSLQCLIAFEERQGQQ